MEGAQASEIGSTEGMCTSKTEASASLSYLGCMTLIGKNAEWKELRIYTVAPSTPHDPSHSTLKRSNVTLKTQVPASRGYTGGFVCDLMLKVWGL